MIKVKSIKLIGDRYIDIIFSNGERRYLYLKAKEVSRSNIMNYKILKNSVSWGNYSLSFEYLYKNSIHIENKLLKIVKWNDYKNGFLELTLNNREVRMLYYENIVNSKIEYNKIILPGFGILDMSYILDNSNLIRTNDYDSYPNILTISHINNNNFSVWFDNDESYMFNLEKVYNYLDKKIDYNQNNINNYSIINNIFKIDNISVLSNDEIYKYVTNKQSI